jgi:alpha-tubulin suppressor-like RCC1 family protein
MRGVAALLVLVLAAGAAAAGPKRVPATTVAAGVGHNCAVTSAGGVRCWGLNDEGQLGDGTRQNRSVPVDVPGLAGVSAVAAGAFHTCVVTVAGGVKCWGYNRYGQLGDGTATEELAPVDVVGLGSGVKAVAAGLHTCALLTTGGVKCWGDNDAGQVGDGTKTNRPTPVDVVGLTSGVAAISTDDVHTCALLATGGVKCWGANTAGQLGDGTKTNRSTPVDVVGLGSGVAAVATGDFASCALMTAGTVKCWGGNDQGQLGDGLPDASSTPVDVVGLGGPAKRIAVGFGHACALLASGAVKCWGYNRNGELGDGATGNRDRPVAVLDAPRDITSLVAGGVHNCGLTRTGGVSCWGDDSYGQLGDHMFGHAKPPVPVVGLGAPQATLTVASRRVSVPRTRAVSVSLRCGAEAACRGMLTLAARKLALGSQRFSIPAGVTRAVKVTLSKRGYDAVTRARRLAVQARASYTRTPGEVVTSARTLTLTAS